MNYPKLKSKAILAPLSGYSDIALRMMAKKYGAGLTFTEFVSSAALIRGNEKAFSLVKTDPKEKPIAVQLFGSSIEEIVAAARLIQHNFTIIDINCGCPAWKVIKTGAGSALLNNPEKIANLVRQLVNAVDKPVTVKIRAGPTPSNINAVEVAKAIEKAGASAITVHGRTLGQNYKTPADWSIIKKVKETVSIPVFGNGDILSPESFKEKLEYSGVDGIMIARGAMGNPYIFKQIEDYMTTGSYSMLDGLEQFKEYLALALHHNLSFQVIKEQAMTFTKGIVGGANLRHALSQTKDIAALQSRVHNSTEMLINHEY